MTQYSQLIVGVFQQAGDAKRAIDALREAGFQNDQIGFALREGGVVTNNLLDDLVKLGVPQDQAAYYESEYKADRAIVSVRADGREDEAARLLQTYGGYNSTNRDASTQGTTNQPTYDQGTYSQGTTNQPTYDQGTYSQSTTNQPTYDQGTDDQALRLRAEQLNVEKQPVQAGEVRLHKDVVEEQKTIDVPVTHEEVYIERRPVTDGQVSNEPIGQDETIRVPVSEEQVNVNKQTVVTGEVGVRKQAVQDTQQVTDTVRHEEPRLERDGDARVRTDDNLNQ
jgi:uncharacterized protein (TIGR02271 family)